MSAQVIRRTKKTARKIRSSCGLVYALLGQNDQDSGNDELAKMIEKDLADAKVRLTSGKDLTHVADLQDKYAKFMKTEGLAYESKLAVNLKQRLK